MNLTECNLNNTPWFTFEGENMKCKVLKVYDGDTIIIAFCYNNGIYKKKCRLLGIDTPEIRTKNIEEKNLGIKVREFVSELISEKIVYINCSGWSKYGDILGTVYLSEEDMINKENSINDILVKMEYAHPYNGKKKQLWIF